MRNVMFLSVFAVAGCGQVIDPGHRGLLFLRSGGLQHDVLGPGWHRVGLRDRLDDFDVTYSTAKETIRTTSSEGLVLDVRLAIIYRPVVTELYELDTEIGTNFYDEVVGPEFRSAARGVFARHSYVGLVQNNEKIEDEIEEDVRRRIAGQHIDVRSVTMESLEYAPEIAQAIREKLVGEQEALRRKVALEADVQRDEALLKAETAKARMRAQTEMEQKEHEHKMAEEQAAIDKTRAEADAESRLVRARAEAQEIELLAKAKAQDKKAEVTALTPLGVMMHAYDALAKLAGDGTTVYLGDFSHVPSFLFPTGVGLPIHAAATESDGAERSARRGKAQMRRQ